MNGSTGQSQTRRWPPAIGPDIHDAMRYVNRVRQRFANDPDKYQQFLGILQTYRQSSCAGPLENVRPLA
ncbi:hypothetical protein DENSPDRAFT_832950 [Dentipellis sp. KUC8613]|nr:hypothetical protein DENSPDRAFT_832950 [Dentipellis sp. KUC8613]